MLGGGGAGWVAGAVGVGVMEMQQPAPKVLPRQFFGSFLLFVWMAAKSASLLGGNESHHHMTPGPAPPCQQVPVAGAAPAADQAMPDAPAAPADEKKATEEGEAAAAPEVSFSAGAFALAGDHAVSIPGLRLGRRAAWRSVCTRRQGQLKYVRLGHSPEPL